MSEHIEPGIGKTVPRVRESAMTAFISHIARECPHFVGADYKHFTDSTLEPATLLSRLIDAVEYRPSTLAIMAGQKALIRKGFLVDADIPQLTLRNMVDHCTKPMLEELAEKIKAHEASLVAMLVEPAKKEVESKPAAPSRETVIVNDEMLGRIEIDAKTAEVLRMVPDTDAMGDVLVDDDHQVVVTSDTETAKQSNVWGSW